MFILSNHFPEVLDQVNDTAGTCTAEGQGPATCADRLPPAAELVNDQAF
jgi:hypothetical protein